LAITLRPGNSGGALVNARGELVGIPHMVTGGGLALAVSTRTVERFLAGQPEPELDLQWV
jgi:S1-C subfamily serine protease